MSITLLPKILMLIAIYFAYGSTFLLAGGMKILGGSVPDWFSEQFKKTVLATFPGITMAYWMIAFLECLVPVFLIISLVKCEFLAGNNPIFLGTAVGLAAVIFGILGFGLRLVNDFPGAANSFFYFAAAVITQLYIIKVVAVS